ncbi:hypothetical protein M8J77_024203 [Diaphorina citri]|nr:hypothetical protein M8J77_024203 [Diaphorina citri]
MLLFQGESPHLVIGLRHIGTIPEFSDGADSPSRITRSARSVVVKYLIGWVFKDGIVNPQDPITPETLNERMESYVRTHNNFLYNYRLPLHKIKSELVLDQCRVNNGHCNHVCQFDYRDLKFECLCPPNFSLDESGHACQPINGDHTHFGGDHTHHGALPEPSSTDHAYPLDPLIDPTAEPGHHGQGLHPLQPLVDPTAEPYPTAEPTAEPGHHGQGLHPLQPLVDPTAEPYPTAEPEPTSTKLNLLNPVEPFLAIDPTALPEVSGGNSRQNSIDPFSANNPTALPEVSANSRHNSIDPTAESNPEDITYETPLQPIPSGDLDVIPTLIPVPGRKEGRNGNLGKLLDFGMFPPLKPIPEDETPFVSVPVTFVPVPVTERVPYVETPPPVRPTVGDTLIGHLADFGMMEDRGKAAFGDTSLQMCAEGLFQCSRNTSYDELVCIPSIARCNGIPDCPGSSDEFGCEENQCHGNFQCGSKRCLAYNHVCNGVPDCEDLSDENEAMCNSRSCDVSSQFHCGSGHCIPLNWRCNGKVGCGNTADEHGCHYTCSKNEFQCPEGRCIPLSFRCNGAPDCTHGEDEQACECPETKFKCESGGCIDYSYVCDGRSHCPDHSDEWSCVNLANDGVHIRRGNQWLPLCNKDKSWTDTYSDVLCQKLGYSKSQKNPRYGDLTDRMDNITDGITRLGDLITDRPHINLTYLSDDPDSFIGTDGVTSLNRNSYVTINPLVSPDIITSHNLFNYLNIYSEEGAGCDDVVQIQCQEFYNH